MNEDTQKEIFQRMVSRPSGCTTNDYRHTRIWNNWRRCKANYEKDLLREGKGGYIDVVKIDRGLYHYKLKYPEVEGQQEICYEHQDQV